MAERVSDLLLWPFQSPWRLTVLGLLFLLILLIPRPLDDRIRYLGLFYQLLGISTVVLDIRDRRRLFGQSQPGLMQGLKSLLVRFRRRGDKSVQVHGVASAAVTADLSISIWRSMSQGQPLEAQLNDIKANLETLKRANDELTTKLDSEVTKRSHSIDAERKARKSELEAVDERLRTLGAGGLNLAWIGVLFLFVGTVCSTISGEVAGLF